MVFRSVTEFRNDQSLFVGLAGAAVGNKQEICFVGRYQLCHVGKALPVRPRPTDGSKLFGGCAAKLAFVQVDRYRSQIFGFHLLRYLKNRAIAYARAGGRRAACKAVGLLAAPIYAHGRVTGKGLLPPGGHLFF